MTIDSKNYSQEMKLSCFLKIQLALIPLGAIVAHGSELCTYPILNQTSKFYFKDVEGLSNINHEMTIKAVKEPSIICVYKRIGLDELVTQRLDESDDGYRYKCRTNWGTLVEEIKDSERGHLYSFFDKDGSNILIQAEALYPMSGVIESGAVPRASVDILEYYKEFTASCGAFKGESWVKLRSHNFIPYSSSRLPFDTRLLEYSVNGIKRQLLIGKYRSIYVGSPTSNRSGKQGSF